MFQMQRSQLQGKSKKVIARLLNRDMCAVFTRWMANVVELRRQRELLRRVAARFKHGELVACFKTWIVFLDVMEEERMAELRDSIALALKTRNLVPFFTWTTNARKRGKYKREVIEKAVQECVEEERHELGDDAHMIFGRITGGEDGPTNQVDEEENSVLTSPGNHQILPGNHQILPEYLRGKEAGKAGQRQKRRPTQTTNKGTHTTKKSFGGAATKFNMAQEQESLLSVYSNPLNAEIDSKLPKRKYEQVRWHARVGRKFNQLFATGSKVAANIRAARWYISKRVRSKDCLGNEAGSRSSAWCPVTTSKRCKTRRRCLITDLFEQHVRSKLTALIQGSPTPGVLQPFSQN